MYARFDFVFRPGNSVLYISTASFTVICRKLHSISCFIYRYQTEE